MKFGLALVGALLGMYVALGGQYFFGGVVGLTMGLMIWQLRSLSTRLKRLEAQQHAPAQSSPQTTTPPPPQTRSVPPASTRQAARPQATTVTNRPQQARPATAASIAPPGQTPRPRTPSHMDRFVQTVKNWFTTGNVPVKVGVVVSFFGVAFLLKYSVDRKLVVLPIELRLLAVAAVAIGLLALGWRLHRKTPVYGLSLQGGGIGMLYLTIFAAFRIYSLLSPLFAFGLLVVLTALAGALAVLQNARALAVLGTMGGFMAPVLISTGSGNHVALFSYYLVLNLAILGIARFRAWRELNLLGFLFTFVIGTGWGYTYYHPELFISTEPFLVLHFLLYQAVAVLFARSHVPKLKRMVDGTIVFGTPVVAFALQAALVKDTEYGLAISAVTVGLFYAGLATWLWSKHRDQLRLLIESYLGLAVAFGTITIPLAVDARWTAAAWSLEGAALVWVGMRQGAVLAKVSGSLLIFAASVAFLEHGWRHGAGLPVLNGNFLGGLLIAASALTASRFFDGQPEPRSRWHRFAALILFGWGALWWLSTGAVEIEDRFGNDTEPQALTLFIALSGLLCTFVATRTQWPRARVATLSHLPLLVLVALVYAVSGQHPFASWGALAWGSAVLIQLKILWDYEARSVSTAALGHGLGVLFAVALLMWEAHWQIDRTGLSHTWEATAAGLVPVLIAGVIMVSGGRIAWPVSRHWSAFFQTAGILAVGALLFVGASVVDNPGDPSPLIYLPIANPFDILTVLALGVGLTWVVRAKDHVPWFDGDYRRLVVVMLWLATFALSTVAVVRGVHHWVGTLWRPERLYHSVAVQAALSIYWGLLGVAVMVAGTRWINRNIWLVGTCLMGLVVIKLFLVDLGNTETIARIVSFIGVGALLLLVGYFAPAPPRGSTENHEAGESESQ